LALKSPRFDGVAIGSIRAANPVLEVQRPIGAIVLANDSSMTQHESEDGAEVISEKSVIEKIVDQLIKSRLDNIQVISSFKAADLTKKLKKSDVKVIHNRAFKLGDMLSSIRVGLRAMPEQMAAALIVIGDQIDIQPKLVYTMFKAYSEGQGDFIVPTYQSLRGYPILIARRYWSEILDSKQTNSFGAFCIAHKDDITLLPVETDSILSKPNSLADYQTEKPLSGLRD
jgi:molybdenum cofactor cytidylyltransferase